MRELELNNGFDRFMTATIILQDLSADLTGDDSLRFCNLNKDARRAMLNKVMRYGVVSHDITTPEQLHDFHTSLKKADGWTVGDFDINEKTTPLICEFNALPEKIKTFLKASFGVLDALIATKQEAS